MFRLLREKNNIRNVKAPSLQLLMVLSDESIVEADSILSLLTALIGKDYTLADNETKCLLRIKLARREAMAAIQNDINVVVSDGNSLINNNFAANKEDTDYKYTKEELESALKIRIDDEKLFLQSLNKLGVIRILERVDSNLLRDTNLIKNNHSNEYVDI